MGLFCLVGPVGIEPTAKRLGAVRSAAELWDHDKVHGFVKHETPRAGDGIRTHEYQLGGLMPYHLATPAILRHYFIINKVGVTLEN